MSSKKDFTMPDLNTSSQDKTLESIAGLLKSNNKVKKEVEVKAKVTGLEDIKELNEEIEKATGKRNQIVEYKIKKNTSTINYYRDQAEALRQLMLATKKFNEVNAKTGGTKGGVDVKAWGDAFIALGGQIQDMPNDVQNAYKKVEHFTQSTVEKMRASFNSISELPKEFQANIKGIVGNVADLDKPLQKLKEVNKTVEEVKKKSNGVNKIHGVNLNKINSQSDNTLVDFIDDMFASMDDALDADEFDKATKFGAQFVAGIKIALDRGLHELADYKDLFEGWIDEYNAMIGGIFQDGEKNKVLKKDNVESIMYQDIIDKIDETFNKDTIATSEYDKEIKKLNSDLEKYQQIQKELSSGSYGANENPNDIEKLIKGKLSNFIGKDSSSYMKNDIEELSLLISRLQNAGGDIDKITIINDSLKKRIHEIVDSADSLQIVSSRIDEIKNSLIQLGAIENSAPQSIDNIIDMDDLSEENKQLLKNLQELQSINKERASQLEEILEIQKGIDEYTDSTLAVSELDKVNVKLEEVRDKQESIETGKMFDGLAEETDKVSESAEESVTALDKEDNILEQLSETAEKTAKSKKKVKDENEKLATSADNSSKKIKGEVVEIKSADEAFAHLINTEKKYAELDVKTNGGKEGTQKQIADFRQLNASREKAKQIINSEVVANSELADKYAKVQQSVAEYVADLKAAASIQSFNELVNQIEKMANSSKYANESTDELKNTLKEMKALQSDAGFFGDIDSVNTKIQQMQEVIEGVETSVNKSTINKMLRNLSKEFNDNSAMSSDLKIRYINLIEEMKLLRNQTVITTDVTGELREKMTALSADLQLSGKTGKSWIRRLFDDLKSANGQLLRTYFSWMDIIRYGKSAVNTIVSLDTALVDLRKTTTMTTSELNDFYGSSNAIAKRMGVTTEEIINQAAAFSRLGYSSKEAATTMSEISSQFASISPDMDVETATDGLVSIMKAFDIEVSDVERQILDNINIIGNTAATSNGEIVDMLKRSSAAMKEANNSLEETIALETAAVEITRNAETTGTAFKTLSMRLRGYDEETEELSEDLKNISGDIADLTKTVQHPLGISLFEKDDPTTYKSTYQFLKDVSDIWDELTDKQQAGLLEKIAGKRGGQVVAGVLNNFDAVEKALGNMEDAAGSADREMGVIRDSIEYKLNDFKQTWVGILQNLIDRGDVGKLIDSLTRASENFGKALVDISPVLGTFSSTLGNIIELVGKLSSTFGGATPFITAFFTAFAKNSDKPKCWLQINLSLFHMCY